MPVGGSRLIFLNLLERNMWFYCFLRANWCHSGFPKIRKLLNIQKVILTISFGSSQAVCQWITFLLGKLFLFCLGLECVSCLFLWFWYALSHLYQATAGILLSNTQLCNHWHIYLWYINLQIIFKAEYFEILKINYEVYGYVVVQLFCFKCKQIGIHTTIAINI